MIYVHDLGHFCRDRTKMIPNTGTAEANSFIKVQVAKEPVHSAGVTVATGCGAVQYLFPELIWPCRRGFNKISKLCMFLQGQCHESSCYFLCTFNMLRQQTIKKHEPVMKS